MGTGAVVVVRSTTGHPVGWGPTVRAGRAGLMGASSGIVTARAQHSCIANQSGLPGV
jgi:hypothetical protein